jgi:hypothetical protein
MSHERRHRLGAGAADGASRTSRISREERADRRRTARSAVVAVTPPFRCSAAEALVGRITCDDAVGQRQRQVRNVEAATLSRDDRASSQRVAGDLGVDEPQGPTRRSVGDRCIEDSAALSAPARPVRVDRVNAEDGTAAVLGPYLGPEAWYGCDERSSGTTARLVAENATAVSSRHKRDRLSQCSGMSLEAFCLRRTTLVLAREWSDDYKGPPGCRSCACHRRKWRCYDPPEGAGNATGLVSEDDSGEWL